MPTRLLISLGLSPPAALGLWKGIEVLPTPTSTCPRGTVQSLQGSAPAFSALRVSPDWSSASSKHRPLGAHTLAGRLHAYTSAHMSDHTNTHVHASLPKRTRDALTHSHWPAPVSDPHIRVARSTGVSPGRTRREVENQGRRE